MVVEAARKVIEGLLLQLLVRRHADERPDFIPADIPPCPDSSEVITLTEVTELMAVRVAALQAAVATHARLGLRLCPGVDRAETIAQAELDIRRTAGIYLAWLHGTVRLRLTPGPIRDQATGLPTGTPTPEGDTMQINTGQKFDVTADTEDAAGYDTPETIAWSIDNGDVAVLTVSEDTHTCTVTSGAPGSAVLTATVTSMDPPLSATLAVDVVPAGTATIELVPGEPVDE